MEKIVNEKNIEKWSGIADMYHNSRPIPPEIITKIIFPYKIVMAIK